MIQTWQVSMHTPDPNGDGNLNPMTAASALAMVGACERHALCSAESTDFLPALSRVSSNNSKWQWLITRDHLILTHTFFFKIGFKISGISQSNMLLKPHFQCWRRPTVRVSIIAIAITRWWQNKLSLKKWGVPYFLQKLVQERSYFNAKLVGLRAWAPVYNGCRVIQEMLNVKCSENAVENDTLCWPIAIEGHNDGTSSVNKFPFCERKFCRLRLFLTARTGDLLHFSCYKTACTLDTRAC